MGRDMATATWDDQTSAALPVALAMASDAIVWGGNSVRLLLIELKAKKTPVSDNQAARHAKLADLGHPVAIVRAETPSHAINQIEALLIDAGAIKGRRAA